MATIPELVDQLAKEFAEVEAAEVKFKKFSVRVHELIDLMVEAKLITKFEGMARKAQFDGVAAGNLGRTAALHLDWTRKGQSVGVDIPQTEGGGDR